MKIQSQPIRIQSEEQGENSASQAPVNPSSNSLAVQGSLTTQGHSLNLNLNPEQQESSVSNPGSIGAPGSYQSSVELPIPDFGVTTLTDDLISIRMQAGDLRLEVQLKLSDAQEELSSLSEEDPNFTLLEGTVRFWQRILNKTDLAISQIDTILQYRDDVAVDLGGVDYLDALEGDEVGENSIALQLERVTSTLDGLPNSSFSPEQIESLKPELEALKADILALGTEPSLYQLNKITERVDAMESKIHLQQQSGEGLVNLAEALGKDLEDVSEAFGEINLEDLPDSPDAELLAAIEALYFAEITEAKNTISSKGEEINTRWTNEQDDLEGSMQNVMDEPNNVSLIDTGAIEASAEIMARKGDAFERNTEAKKTIRDIYEKALNALYNPNGTSNVDIRVGDAFKHLINANSIKEGDVLTDKDNFNSDKIKFGNKYYDIYNNTENEVRWKEATITFKQYEAEMDGLGNEQIRHEMWWRKNNNDFKIEMKIPDASDGIEDHTYSKGYLVEDDEYINYEDVEAVKINWRSWRTADIGELWEACEAAGYSTFNLHQG